jgi:hypothetical protein
VSVGPTAGVAAAIGRGVSRTITVEAAVWVARAPAVAAAGVPANAVSRVGVGPPDNVEVTAPTALNSAPTADQARLPSSRMPTIPTMMTISRAGEPSSGRADRSTSL